MRMDDIKDGQRINCNGVYGTVIGKRNTRNRRFLLVKMDNGFTLKLNGHERNNYRADYPHAADSAEAAIEAGRR
jgi:hypothetical protein